MNPKVEALVALILFTLLTATSWLEAYNAYQGLPLNALTYIFALVLCLFGWMSVGKIAHHHTMSVESYTYAPSDKLVRAIAWIWSFGLAGLAMWILHTDRYIQDAPTTGHGTLQVAYVGLGVPALVAVPVVVSLVLSARRDRRFMPAPDKEEKKT